MRPMKGTAFRGRTREEDEVHAQELRESSKERSENLMIVDMIRSDLGKICDLGSVRVVQPLQVERYETLLQMTSTVTGHIRAGTGIVDIFGATFPSGSVTGAPKVRTMQIIHELEKEPRGIYTGAIGFISSDESVFNVAIRTACIDLRRSRIEMGVGSGILYEADAVREYQECELKGKFLIDSPQEFQLLETILWTPNTGFCRLELHLDRLLQSADYFLFSVKRETIESVLQLQESSFPAAEVAQRVRLLVNRYGDVDIHSTPLESLQELPRIRFAESRTDSSDRFLFHKTTWRSLYDEELRNAREEGYFDLIFRNERDEITEGAISNIFLVRRGIYFTPPIPCGLLAGTFRRHLLETRPFPIEERVLHEEDLRLADAIYLSNAIRGLLRVVL